MMVSWGTLGVPAHRPVTTSGRRAVPNGQHPLTALTGSRWTVGSSNRRGEGILRPLTCTTARLQAESVKRGIVLRISVTATIC
jgi:hypothetical protein